MEEGNDEDYQPPVVPQNSVTAAVVVAESNEDALQPLPAAGTGGNRDARPLQQIIVNEEETHRPAAVDASVIVANRSKKLPHSI